jgi:hypothetical protein
MEDQVSKEEGSARLNVIRGLLFSAAVFGILALL